MAEKHSVTQARIEFGLRTFGASPLPVPVELEHDTEDPYAIVAILHAGTNVVRWIFGRDLLADGLLAP
ncbi:SsgA family sporulation/cell division regulator, partial [Amycolatopsis sp. NPDC059027]